MNINEILRKCLLTESNYNRMLRNDKEYYNVAKILGYKKLTQSQSVRFGFLFEEYLKGILKELGIELFYDKDKLIDLFGLDRQDKKGKKDIDICFIKNRILYYFESKANSNLDAEKVYVTKKKIRLIKEYMKKHHDVDDVKVGVLTMWYEKEKNMSIKFKNETQLFFFKDFLEILEYENEVTKEDYYNNLLEFGKNLEEIENGMI